MVVPFMMMPHDVNEPVFWAVPQAISQLRIVLPVQPFPTATLDSPMAAVVLALL
jgi:hypothetical protein